MIFVLFEEFTQIKPQMKADFADISSFSSAKSAFICENLREITIMTMQENTQNNTILALENRLLSLETAFSDALLFAKMGNWAFDLNSFQLILSNEKQLLLGIENPYKMPLILSLNEYGQKYVYPEDLPIIQKSMELLIKHKNEIGYTLQLDYRATATCKLKYFHLKCEIRENYQVYGFTQDHTEQKLAEIKAKENEKLYEHLVETLPDMVLLHRNGIILFANETLYKRTGFSKAEVIGKSVLAFDLPENRQKSQEIIERREKGEKIPDYELTLRIKNGETLLLRVKASVVYIQQQLTTLIVFEDITYLKASQEKIEKNNALLTSVLNSPSQTIIFSLDKEYCYTSFNENHLNMMRHIWGRDIAIGENRLSYIKDEKEKQETKSHFDRVLLGESFQLIAEYGESPNQFFYESSYNPIKDEKGNVTGLTVFLFDITSLKRTEEALMKSQKESNTIFDNTFDALFLVEESTHKIVRCNRRATALFEVENKHEITHVLGYEHFMPGETYQLAIDTSLKNGEVWQQELEYVSAKGRLFWGNLSIKKVITSPEMGFFIMKISDITERKKMELELKEKQKFIKKVINAVPNLIFVKDAQGRFVLVNKAFAEYYGVDAQSIIGKTDLDIVPDKYKNYLTYYRESDQKVLNTGESVFLPEVQKVDAKTGEMSVHQTEKVLLIVGEGEKQILGVATNITERKKADAERLKLVESLMQNVQDLEQFTYMVSHNLRSHVARILGLAGLLDSKNKDNPFNDYIFTTVVDEATRLDAIIGDLNIILAVRNNNDEKREQINLKEMCDSVLLSIVTDIEKHGAKIAWDIPQNHQIYTIKTYSYSIILNLLSNAIKYRNPEKQLHISVKAYLSSDEQHICFSVKDNGLGIDLAQNKDKVFGLYRRFHTHVEGKGIGLHITKTQIERMGGKIAVESELNVGTNFTVYFPV